MSEDAIENSAAELEFEQGFEAEAEVVSPAAVESAAEPAETSDLTKIMEELATLRERTKEFDELKAAQKALADNAFGRIGSLKQAFDQLTAARDDRPAEAFQISDDDLEELRSEYPDLTDNLVKGLNKALAKTSLRGAVSSPELGHQQLAELVTSRLTPAMQELETKIEQKFEIRALDRVQPDWREVTAADGFKSWVAAQPDDLAKRFYDSWDSTFLGDTLARYKQAAKKPEPAKNDADHRRARLAAAVQPRGVGGHAPGATDEDQFLAGFNGR